MKRNLFKAACSLIFGMTMLLLTGNIAFADVVAPGPLESGGGLLLILGIVSLVLVAVAMVVIINIRKKKAK